RDRLWIATAETEVGAVRHRSQVGLRVAQPRRGRARRAAAARAATPAAAPALLLLTGDGAVRLADRCANLICRGCLHRSLSCKTVLALQTQLPRKGRRPERFATSRPGAQPAGGRDRRNRLQ